MILWENKEMISLAYNKAYLTNEISFTNKYVGNKSNSDRLRWAWTRPWKKACNPQINNNTVFKENVVNQARKVSGKGKQ